MHGQCLFDICVVWLSSFENYLNLILISRATCMRVACYPVPDAQSHNLPSHGLEGVICGSQ